LADGDGVGFEGEPGQGSEPTIAVLPRGSLELLQTDDRRVGGFFN
jgi:hypothetical protein